MGERLVVEPRACMVGRHGQVLSNKRQAQKADMEEQRADAVREGKEAYLKVKWKNMTALTMAITVTMATSMPYTQIHLASL